MAQKEVDPIDVGALVLFPVAAGMVMEIFSFSIDVFGGYAFGDALFSIAGAAVTLPLLVAVGSIAWIYATNELDGSQYSDEEKYAMGAAILIVPMYVAVPFFRNLINSSDIIALVAWLAVAVFAVYISYIE